MVTSTTQTWNLDVATIVRLAHRRAFGTDDVSGLNALDAVIYLNIVITDLINRGAPISTLKLYQVALTSGVSTITLAGTIIDIYSPTVIDSSTGTDLAYVIERIGIDDYNRINNKTTPGRPSQFMIDRKVSNSTVFFYPVPDLTTYTFSYYGFTRNYDVTALNQDIDLNYRYTPALISGLAYYLLLQSPKNYTSEVGLPILGVFKNQYESELKAAFEQDREKASTRISMRLNIG